MEVRPVCKRAVPWEAGCWSTRSLSLTAPAYVPAQARGRPASRCYSFVRGNFIVNSHFSLHFLKISYICMYRCMNERSGFFISWTFASLRLFSLHPSHEHANVWQYLLDVAKATKSNFRRPHTWFIWPQRATLEDPIHGLFLTGTREHAHLWLILLARPAKSSSRRRRRRRGDHESWVGRGIGGCAVAGYAGC